MLIKKSVNPCYYYDRPNESQIHKDAKMLMKMLLDNKTSLSFYRKCFCKRTICVYELTKDSYNKRTAIIEYKFHYNNSNCSADVALVENGDIKYIFEICYKNKTREENRPEPWIEIDAETFINIINSKNDKIKIECKRDYTCKFCKEKEMYEIKQQLQQIQFKQFKEREQKNEMEELSNMRKEDEKLIQKQRYTFKTELTNCNKFCLVGFASKS